MNRLLTVGVVVAVQAALVVVGVAPQISARATGETHTFRVEPVDPIDPFRGAYVDPRLPRPAARPLLRRWGRAGLDGRRRERRALHRPHRGGRPQRGDRTTSASARTPAPTSPATTPCGRSAAASRAGSSRRTRRPRWSGSSRDGAVAEVRIDSRGNAALMDVRAE